MFAWPVIFDGAAWFHVTGITPALGAPVADCTREAIEAARAAGARVSIDLNYRKKLWTEARAREVMRPLTAMADVVIANEEDIQSSLGLDVSGANVTAATLEVAGYRKVAERVAQEFGVKLVAVTLRESHSASRNGWSAVLYDAAGGAFHQSQSYDVTLIDRIGGGDSFAAGLIYGLVSGRTPEASLRFAVAASALKQTIPGDFNRVSAAEVDRLAGAMPVDECNDEHHRGSRLRVQGSGPSEFERFRRSSREARRQSATKPFATPNCAVMTGQSPHAERRRPGWPAGISRQP